MAQMRSDRLLGREVGCGTAYGDDGAVERRSDACSVAIGGEDEVLGFDGAARGGDDGTVGG